jgi:hypothetical protein
MSNITVEEYGGGGARFIPILPPVSDVDWPICTIWGIQDVRTVHQGHVCHTDQQYYQCNNCTCSITIITASDSWYESIFNRSFGSSSSSSPDTKGDIAPYPYSCTICIYIHNSVDIVHIRYDCILLIGCVCACVRTMDRSIDRLIFVDPSRWWFHPICSLM